MAGLDDTKPLFFRSPDAPINESESFGVSIFADGEQLVWVGIQLGRSRAGMNPVAALRLAGALVAAAEEVEHHRAGRSHKLGPLS